MWTVNFMLTNLPQIRDSPKIYSEIMVDGMLNSILNFYLIPSEEILTRMEGELPSRTELVSFFAGNPKVRMAMVEAKNRGSDYLAWRIQRFLYRFETKK